MAISAAIKIDDKKIQKRINRIKNKFPRLIDRGILQAGFQLLAIIREKTIKGIDVEGNKFAPYTEGYLKKLQREGKKTDVDLIYSGRMLGALIPSSRTVRKTGRHKFSVGFSNSEMRKRAFFNQFTMGSNNRRFFGFSKRTQNIISKTFIKFVSKEFRKI